MADTEIPVIMRFLADTQDIQEGTKEVEESTEQAFNELGALAEEAARLAGRSVDKLHEAFVELEVRAIQTGLAVTAALAGGTSLALVELGKNAVKAASGFEDLRTRIQGMTGDVEEAAKKFNEGVKFTAETPFTVESIEAALATLEAFGQGGKENLTLVGNIAAATGGRLEDVSLRVAKALNGTSEGFQGLRDTAGLTGERLARYGAILSETGNVSLQTAEEIQAATNALKAFGSNEISNSMELLSQTYTGALNNAANAVKLFQATIGEALLPTLTSLANGFATGVNAATKLIQPFSGLIAVMGGLAAAAAGAVGVIAGMAIPFAAIIGKILIAQKVFKLAQAAIVGFSGSSALLGVVQARMVLLTATTGQATIAFKLFNTAGTFFAARVAPGITAGLAAIRTASLAVIASPLAPVLAAVAVAAGISTVATNRYVEAQEKLGASIQKSSKDLAQATSSFRSYAEFLEGASGQDISFGLDVGKTAEETAEALQKLSAVDLAAAARKNGITIQQLTTDLAANRTQADETREKMIGLQTALNSTSGGFVDVFRQSDEVRKILKDTFGDETQVRVEDVEKALRDTNLEFQRLGQVRVIITELLDSLGEIPTALAEANKEAEALNNFLGFASRLTDVSQLNSALDLTKTKIADIEDNLQTAVGTLDRFELTKKLADPNIDEEAENAIKSYLSLLDSRASLEDKIAGQVEAARKKERDAFELVTERRKVLGDLTLEQERDRVSQQLDTVKKGTEEEVSLLKRLAALDEQIRKERVDKTKKLVNDQLDAVKDGLAEVKSRPAASNADVAEELRDSIRALEVFERVNRRAFAGAPEAAERFKNEVAGLKRELRTVEAAQLVDQFRELKSVVENGLSSVDGSAQKIEQTSMAIDTLKKAIAAGTIDRAQGEEYIASLEQKKLGYIREQTDEKLRQAGEIAELEARALDQEIRILELRQQAGENVDQALAESRAKRLEMTLEAIEQEKMAEIAAAQDRESIAQAEQKATLKRNAAIKDEAARQFQEIAKSQNSLSQLSSGVQRLVSSPSGASPFATGGGVDSPYSAGASGNLFSGVQATQLPSFAEGFGVSRFKRPEAPKPPRFGEIQKRIEEQASGGVKSGATDTVSTTTVNHMTTVNVSDNAGDFYEKQLAEAARKMMDQRRQKKMTSSGTTTSPKDVGRLY